jgi:hypothetical protein
LRKSTTSQKDEAESRCAAISDEERGLSISELACRIIERERSKLCFIDR